MRFHALSFIVAFCVGITVMLCVVPRPSIVVKFPRPETGDEVYKTTEGACFKVKARKVPCSSETVLPQPTSDTPGARGDRGVHFKMPFA